MGPAVPPLLRWWHGAIPPPARSRWTKAGQMVPSPTYEQPLKTAHLPPSPAPRPRPPSPALSFNSGMNLERGRKFFRGRGGGRAKKSCLRVCWSNSSGPCCVVLIPGVGESVGRREEAPRGNKASSRLNSFVRGYVRIYNDIRSYKCSSATQVPLPSPEARDKVATRGISVLQCFFLVCSTQGAQFTTKIGSQQH